MLAALLRRVRKTRRALATARGRRALRLGAAPAIEHDGAFAAIADDLGGAERMGLIVDVGANVGQFALAARAAFPHAAIHAAEPQPDAADRLAAIFADDPALTLHRAAFGATAGTMRLHLTGRADSASLLAPKLQGRIYPGAGATGRTADVPVRRLDDLALPAPDPARPGALLKLDVQGAELEALRGAEAILPRFDHVLAELSWVELYAGQPLADEVAAWLAARGFRMAGMHVSDGSFDAAGRAIQADFLFRRAPAPDPASGAAPPSGAGRTDAPAPGPA